MGWVADKCGRDGVDSVQVRGDGKSGQALWGEEAMDMLRRGYMSIDYNLSAEPA